MQTISPEMENDAGKVTNFRDAIALPHTFLDELIHPDLHSKKFFMLLNLFNRVMMDFQ
jgi:hypothetical protein